MSRRPGFTLAEVIVATAIFATAVVLIGDFFDMNLRFFSIGSSQADAGASGITAIGRLEQDLQESDPTSASVSGSGSSSAAILFVSARNSSGQFQFSLATTPPGQPAWQKWICYYLTPQSGSSYSMLVRVEGQSSSWGLPTSGNPPSPAFAIPVPSTWLAAMKTGSGSVVARDVKNMSFITGNPFYVQVISESDYRSAPTTYNPGFVNGTCCWIQIKLNN